MVGKRLGNNFNYGIAILRIWMTFEVILCHFWLVERGEISGIWAFFYDCKQLAVPIFMIMSFFLLEPHLKEGYTLIGKRLYRLAIPYVVWPFIYYLVWNITGINGDIRKSSILWQLLLGSSMQLCSHLWYQWNLIVLTILTIVLFNWLSEIRAYIVLAALGVIGIVFQYSGINYMLFGELAYEQRYTLGRIAEMLPYVFIGLILSKLIIIEKIKCNRNINIISIIIGIVMFLFGAKNGLVLSPCEQFGYAGIMYIVVASIIFVVMAILPMDNIWEYIGKVVKFLSKYSFGVYCVHVIVGKVLEKFMVNYGLQMNQFAECIVIFGICYIVVYLISLVPLKLCRQLVS